jgi:hypothetical protein
VLVSANHKHPFIEKKQEKMTLLGLMKTSWFTLVTTEEIQRSVCKISKQVAAAHSRRNTTTNVIVCTPAV